MGVYRSLDMGTIKGTRLMGIWNEFTNKLIAAGRAANKYQFLEALCRSWGLNSITKDYVLRALDALSDYELLNTVRNESIYIVLKLRALKDTLKEEGIILKTKMDISESFMNGGDLHDVVQSEDAVPCISGNSIRGKLRRLAMADFCKQAGIIKIDKRIYHILFSGGFLDQSTQFENFDRMEQFVAMCPMLGVLGSAIGNMTIEGEVKIGWAYPLCKERGTGDKSYWQYLDTVFQTRHDSSKTESDLEITGDTGAPQQMKYEYEVFADGTPFEHKIVFTSDDELLTAAFWHMLCLFHDAPFLGGMGSIGNGEVEPDWSLASGAAYDNYLIENKAKIKEFWKSARV